MDPKVSLSEKYLLLHGRKGGNEFSVVSLKADYGVHNDCSLVSSSLSFQQPRRIANLLKIDMAIGFAWGKKP